MVKDQHGAAALSSCHHYQPASRLQGSDDTAAESCVVQSRIIVAPGRTLPNPSYTIGQL